MKHIFLQICFKFSIFNYKQMKNIIQISAGPLLLLHLIPYVINVVTRASPLR